MRKFDLSVEVKELPISELVENVGQIPDVPRNPRKITKERAKALIESHKQSPEMERLHELIVFPYKGKYVVISGNHRLRARRELKWEKCWCKILGAATSKKKAARVRNERKYAVCTER